MYIFLDIDGVLVKEDDPESDGLPIDLEEDFVKFDPVCLGKFEAVIRQSETCKIVISSSWREIFSLKTIKNLFSPDVAEKVVGMTPMATRPVKYYRYYEITSYLESNKLSQEDWVAIDDIPEHFPKDTPLVITNPYIGFDSKAAENLKNHLTPHHHPPAADETPSFNLAMTEDLVMVITAEGQIFVRPDKKTAERVVEDGEVIENEMIFTLKSGKIYKLFFNDNDLEIK
ncbi:MAG: hypothetical protein BWK79_14185 [Beggiatoa sp. IS2]|nr:MAG: hypothetical protein BWK79_14185 [Beggiatoa sp. IS2]